MAGMKRRVECPTCKRRVSAVAVDAVHAFSSIQL